VGGQPVPIRNSNGEEWGDLTNAGISKNAKIFYSPKNCKPTTRLPRRWYLDLKRGTCSLGKWRGGITGPRDEIKTEALSGKMGH